MKETDVDAKPKSKVIRLHMDATFFFDKAVQSLECYHYEKALKYFRKATECEPDNPVNYCNMAGILSEIGKYDESNELLRKVVEEIDPQMTECYFYMANNYANMENYALAEKALVHYLEQDPEGYYIEESKEMMELISYELNRPVTYKKVKSVEDLDLHEQAKKLIEEGNFTEAVQLLETIVADKPDFIPAKNNLALAYYYTNQIEQGFAMIEEVLEQEHDNIHALCNLAVLLQHAGKYKQATTLVRRLSNIIPFTDDHLFKLALTLGILGQHESAYFHFLRMIRSSVNPEPVLYHYAAVAATFTKRYTQAKRWWKQAERLDPESDVPTYYLKQLDNAVNGEKVLFSYHYHLPFDEQIRVLISKLPRWEDAWQQVMELALAHMKNRYDSIQLYDMQTLWIEFLSKVYPEAPMIRKTNGWAGALEYLTAKMYRKSVTYREISERYEVSISTIRKHVRRVEKVCRLSMLFSRKPESLNQ